MEQQLRLCHALWPSTLKQQEKMIEKIEDIFQLKYRRYLSMFRLRQDTSLTNTIFRAVFNSKNNNQTSLNQINQEIVFSSRRAKRATEVARTSCELELCGWGA